MPSPNGMPETSPASTRRAARGWNIRRTDRLLGTNPWCSPDGVHSVRDGVGRSPVIIAVTGLAFEAYIAGGVTVVGAELRKGTRLPAEIARGGRGIISFGIGGGLADGLSAGQWIVARMVVSDQERHQTDDGWSRTILQALPGARHGIIAGVDAPLADPRRKRALHARTGAVLVDTETHHVARVAATHGVPFAACRVVVDPAHRHLPACALLELLPDGTLDRRAILRSVLRQPRSVILKFESYQAALSSM
jgi:adenosylhomocysteine nucleosidase